MNAPDPKAPPNEVEVIKSHSRLLRGTIADGLVDPLTGAIAAEDNALLKFHGSYQQDDRDLREERRRQKLEPAYQFMIRVRMPGGVCTPAQWLALDELAGEHANGTLRLTTRQTFQFHGIRKAHFKPAMQAIRAAGLDTIAACGDVNRNVLASANPYRSPLHAAAGELARGHQRAPAAENQRLSRNLARRAGRGPGHRGRADLRPALPAAQVQDRRCRTAGQRCRCLRPRPVVHRRGGRRAAGRLQRAGRRRHGHDPRREGHLPASGRRDRFLHARAGHRGGRAGGVRAARFRRPQQPPPCAVQVHHRRPRRGLVQGRTGTPAGLRAGAGAAVRLRPQHRRVWLAGRAGRPVALHAVRRERPHRGSRPAAPAHGPARNRPHPHGDFRAHQQPERDHRRRQRPRSGRPSRR